MSFGTGTMQKIINLGHLISYRIHGEAISMVWISHQFSIPVVWSSCHCPNHGECHKCQATIKCRMQSCIKYKCHINYHKYMANLAEIDHIRLGIVGIASILLTARAIDLEFCQNGMEWYVIKYKGHYTLFLTAIGYYIVLHACICSPSH